MNVNIDLFLYSFIKYSFWKTNSICICVSVFVYLYMWTPFFRKSQPYAVVCKQATYFYILLSNIPFGKQIVCVSVFVYMWTPFFRESQPYAVVCKHAAVSLGREYSAETNIPTLWRHLSPSILTHRHCFFVFKKNLVLKSNETQLPFASVRFSSMSSYWNLLIVLIYTLILIF